MNTRMKVIALCAGLMVAIATGAYADGPSCCTKAQDSETAASAGTETPPLAIAQGPGKGHGGNRAVMQNAHTLVFNNGTISRTIEDLENGVRTVNTTTDPNLVATLQKHPREMYSHYQAGGKVRGWDPLFAELAKVGDQVEMSFTLLDNGIEVVSTSANPEVVKLIQAHARKVSEFVARGVDAMHEPTAIPEDYKRADGSKASSEPTGSCCGMCKKDAANAVANVGAPSAEHQH